MTKNPYSKRIKQLQTGNGCELHLIKLHETYYPFYIEKSLHMSFQNKRENGEWFKLTNDDIGLFDELCDKYEKLIDSLKDNPFFIKNLR